MRVVMLSPTLRRLLYAFSFEAGAIALSTLLLWALNAAPATDSLVVSVLVTGAHPCAVSLPRGDVA